MNTTLYMVTSGCYSDYHVCGIYSTKAKAQRAHDLFAADNPIRKIILDEVPDAPPGLCVWSVAMDRDGNTSTTRRESVEWYKDRTLGWEPYGNDDDVVFHVWASDEPHAIKIANEQRVQLIASNQWTTDFDEWVKRQPKR